MNTKNPDSFKQFSSPFSSDDGLRHKSVRGAFFMATTGGVEFVVRLGATLILARILSPEDFGLVAMVMALTGLVDLVKDLGLGMATVQRKDITHREISSLFWINMSVGGLLALAFLAISPAISWFYEDSRLITITPPLAATLLWGGMAVQHEALLTRQLKQGHLAVIRLSTTLLSSAGGIVLALVGFGYWSLVVREVTRSFIYLLGVWWACRWMPAFLLRPKEVRGFLSFGRDLTLGNFVNSITRIDGILVGKFFGSEVLGLYRQAQNLISTPVEQLNGPVFNVAQPGISSLQSEPDRYRRYYQRVVGFVALVTMPLGVFAVAYPEDLTLVVLGEQWLPVAPFIAVFAVAAALRPTMATTSLVLFSLGRAKVMFYLTLVHSLVLTLLMFASLPWGALGIATVHVATSIITFPVTLHYSLKESPVSRGVFFSAIKMSLISTVCMGVSLVLFRLMVPIESPFSSLLAGCAVGSITYLLPWMLLPTGRMELRLILEDFSNALLRRAVRTGPSAVGKHQESRAAT